MRKILVLTFLLGLPVGCLETKETLVVHPDGSVDARVQANGDPWDFADGYPLPAQDGWTPVGARAAAWQSAMASADVEAWNRTIEPPPEGEKQPCIELVMEGHFDSVEDIPRYHASPNDPYTKAFLRRSTELTTRESEAGTVYRFERTYHRSHDLYQIMRERFDKIGEEIPEELRLKFEQEEVLTDRDWEVFVEHIADTYELAGTMIAREAVAAVYTEGDGSVSPAAARRIAEEVGQRVAGVLDPEDFIEHDRQKRAGEIAEDTPGPFEDAEEAGRQVLRETLARRLDAEGVEWGVRNAILGRAEFILAAWDQAEDLRDEKFQLKLTLPGAIVGGNFHERTAETVSWSFSGEAMLGGDVVLRAVSVLE